MIDRQITVRVPQEQLFLRDLVNAVGNLSFEDLGLFHPLERNARLNSWCLTSCEEYTMAIMIHPEFPQDATVSNNFRSLKNYFIFH